MTLTAGIPYPTAGEVAAELATAAANRIARLPSIGSVLRANPIVLALGLALTPTTMGDGTLPNPVDTLSPSQMAWANTVTERLGLPSGWLAQNLAMKQHAANMAGGGTLTEDDYDQVAEDTYKQAQAAGQLNIAQSAVTTGGVRVTSRERERPANCIVGPYQDILDICAGEAHHIVPDMAYRLGARPTGAATASPEGRIPGAPTLKEGMSICLTPAQHGSGPTGIHGRLRPKLNALGAASPVPGTAPMGAITIASLSEINAIPDISPECKEYAAVRTVEQVTNGPGLAAPGRTREAPLPSADAKRVLAAGSY
ncbi:hypothetical protein JMM59_11765 [Rhodovulum sulfidophilum]|uniref:hypothetical protein n=1 Tax=Rhodovulum sulfidophilum TaxID=35806 RepID=UPI00192343D7|nr:hypothetical protein [Rhodovulum sulfidophilum]MBL3565676.1 hypothetical protein [Rhodovulum sulfidophilum]